MKFESVGLVTAAFTFWIAPIGAATAQSERAEKHVTADQAIACIKTAVSTRQGRVRDVEIDVKDGKTVCEVEVIAANGKKSEVQVDITTNKVIRVKE